MHWPPRVQAELTAAVVRGASSVEFDLSIKPADVRDDRPPAGAPPVDADRFAARQLQLWLGRCRNGDLRQRLRFHATIARGVGDRRDLVVLFHGVGGADAMLASWPGAGALHAVVGDDVGGLRVLRPLNACEVVKTRASLHYGEPAVAAARREALPRRPSVKARGAFATRGPRRLLFGPKGSERAG